ncbi:restriction endonuclease subunit S [Fusobacterium sp. SYSU M8D902]|uniref:restriction endonuclease subunit S n=1 Tax=Fusobacterium sp. SYSU M8D902 TaxID=3159562 RepID=UPI0032E3F3E4
MRKVPKLRFKEFSDEWEEKSYKDIFKINQGLQIAINERFLEPANNRMFYITNEFLKKDSKIKYYIENPPLNVICSKDDILMTRTGNTGQVVTNVEGAFHNNFFKINYSKEKFNKYFICLLLKSNKIQKTILKLAGTSTIPDLNHSDFYRIKSIIPSIKEQEKIANFLSTVDKKISLTEEKLELFKEYRKGVMQKIFFQELRFKDNEGNDYPEWKEGKIKDFGYFYYGKSAPKHSVVELGGTPCIRYGELYSTYNEYIKEIKSYTNIPINELKLSKGGEVLVPRVGEDPLDFANCSYLPLENIAIGEMISVYNTEENGLFITYYFNATMKKEFAKYVEGASVSNLYFTYLENIKIIIPSSLEEQQKIADFLSSIDSKIEKIEKELENLKEFKKGLLQQMFV